MTLPITPVGQGLRWAHIVALTVLLSACSIPSREATRPLRLDLQPIADLGPDHTSGTAKLPIQWAELVAAPALQTDRMIYRIATGSPDQSQQLGYFAQARWVAPIDQLVDHALRNRLPRHGIVPLTVSPGDSPRANPDLAWLRTSLDRFEVIYDSTTQGRAILQLTATVEPAIAQATASPSGLARSARQQRWQCETPIDSVGPNAAAVGLRLSLDHAAQTLADWIRSAVKSTADASSVTACRTVS